MTGRSVNDLAADVRRGIEWNDRGLSLPALAELVSRLETAEAQVAALNVEDALDIGNPTVGAEQDPVVTAGHAYAALLRSKVTELRAEAGAE